MSTALTATARSATYGDCLQLGNSGAGLATTPLVIRDGLGNVTAVSIGPTALTGASTTSNFLNITGTCPSGSNSAQVNAVNYQITSAGSDSQVQAAFKVSLIAGFTGNKASYAGQFNNAALGTQSITQPFSQGGNVAVEGITSGAAGGTSVNRGGWFRASGNTNENAALTGTVTTAGGSAYSVGVTAGLSGAPTVIGAAFFATISATGISALNPPAAAKSACIITFGGGSTQDIMQCYLVASVPCIRFDGYGGISIAQPSDSSGSPSSALAITVAQHSALAASTRYRTLTTSGVQMTWATGGTVTSQEDYFFARNAYATAGATTFTDCATVVIENAPNVTNGVGGITLTNTPSALWVKGGQVRFDYPSIATTPTTGLLLINTASAGAGTQQFSPSLVLSGQGWKTAATAGSQQCDWQITCQPVQATNNPTSNLVFASQINGAGFNTVFSMTSAGGSAGTGTFQGALTVTGQLVTGSTIKITAGQAIFPTTDSTTAFLFTKADAATAVLTVDTTNNKITFPGGGIASTPAVVLTTTPYSAGTATTNKPQFLIEPTGTISTGWNTSGNYLGVNAAAGFTGYGIAFQVAGSRRFDVDGNGVVGIIGTTGNQPRILVGLVGETGRVTIGLDASDNANIQMGPGGGGSRDIALARNGAGQLNVTDTSVVYCTAGKDSNTTTAMFKFVNSTSGAGRTGTIYGSDAFDGNTNGGSVVIQAGAKAGSGAVGKFQFKVSGGDTWTFNSGTGSSGNGSLSNAASNWLANNSGNDAAIGVSGNVAFYITTGPGACMKFAGWSGSTTNQVVVIPQQSSGGNNGTDVSGLQLNFPKATGGGTATNIIGLDIPSLSVTTGGAVTNSYGIRVAAATSATNNYAVQFLGGITLDQAALTGSPVLAFTLTTPAHTALTASTEYNTISVTAATQQWATGALTLNRFALFGSVTYSFVGASTLATAVGYEFQGPKTGTNATLTKGICLRAISGEAAGVALVAQGFANQTGNLQEWQDSTGAVLASVSSAGTITTAAALKLPLKTDTDGATVTFDMNVANGHVVVLAGNRTLAVSNVAVGQRFFLILTQDGTGSRVVTWFSGISWAGGSAPTLTTTANKSDVISMVCTASNTYLATVAQNF